MAQMSGSGPTVYGLAQKPSEKDISLLMVCNEVYLVRLLG